MTELAKLIQSLDPSPSEIAEFGEMTEMAELIQSSQNGKKISTMTNIFQMQIIKKSIIKSPHEHVYQGPTKKNNDEETANIEKNNSVMKRKYRQ